MEAILAGLLYSAMTSDFSDPPHVWDKTPEPIKFWGMLANVFLPELETRLWCIAVGVDQEQWRDWAGPIEAVPPDYFSN